jgi:diguanylate cyclase (GGDEF)-like protein
VSNRNDQTQIFDAPSWLDGEPDAPLRPVLVVVQGEDLGRRYPLTERRHLLGRDPRQANIVVADAGVSGKHAMIQLDHEGGRYGLIDLASRNGTFVNGKRVEGAALREGDKIFLGKTVLKFTLHDSIEEDYHSQLDVMMHVDSLTGLYVRRWFDDHYPKAFARAREADVPLCVFMMDMDGLKAVNDKHGHQMGSFCISEAGKIIKRHIEPNGMGCRFGGDEFVAFLRGFATDDGLDLAELIRRDVSDFEFTKNGVTVAPTISIGVASLGPEVANADDLTRMADEALYRAKKAGRNVVAGP